MVAPGTASSLSFSTCEKDLNSCSFLTHNLVKGSKAYRMGEGFENVDSEVLSNFRMSLEAFRWKWRRPGCGRGRGKGGGEGGKHCSALSSFRASISEGFVSCSGLGFQPLI